MKPKAAQPTDMLKSWSRLHHPVFSPATMAKFAKFQEIAKENEAAAAKLTAKKVAAPKKAMSPKRATTPKQKKIAAPAKKIAAPAKKVAAPAKVLPPLDASFAPITARVTPVVASPVVMAIPMLRQQLPATAFAVRPAAPVAEVDVTSAPIEA